MGEDASLRNEPLNLPSIEGVDIDAAVPEPYPLVTLERYQLTNREVEALIKSNPGVILELIQENQRQQARNQEQGFELEKIKIQNEQQIKIQKEDNKLKSEQQNRKIVIIAIGAFCTIFAGTLIYAARVNDKNLPNTVITAVISLLAGGSTSIAFSNKRGGDKEQDKPSKQSTENLPS